MTVKCQKMENKNFNSFVILFYLDSYVIDTHVFKTVLKKVQKSSKFGYYSLHI